MYNIYAPNDDAPNFFKEVFEIIDKIDNENIIIGGDLNTTLSKLDRKGGKAEDHKNKLSANVIFRIH